MYPNFFMKMNFWVKEGSIEPLLEPPLNQRLLNVVVVVQNV